MRGSHSLQPLWGDPICLAPLSFESLKFSCFLLPGSSQAQYFLDYQVGKESQHQSGKGGQFTYRGCW